MIDIISQLRDQCIPNVSAQGKLQGGDKSLKNFHDIFGRRKMYYEIRSPDLSKRPNVGEFAFQGTRVYFVRWSLFCPGFVALCRCGEPLKGKRWSCAQASGKAKQLLFSGGVVHWVVSWVLECPG